MEFADYLKTCRRALGLTQSELAEKFYFFDDERFGGVEAATISKWERGVLVPSSNRIAEVLKALQTWTGQALPCIGMKEEEAICRMEVENLFFKKRHKSLVAHTADGGWRQDAYDVLPLRHFKDREAVAGLCEDLREAVVTPSYRLEARRLGAWAMEPSHHFGVVTYRGLFVGMLFGLRIRPEAFESLMGFHKTPAELSEADFATLEESGSLYLFAFYAIGDLPASMLLARLYAHLIAHQERIERVGILSPLKDAADIAERLGLSKRSEKEVEGIPLQAYDADLFGLLSTATLARLLFAKEYCNEAE
ncbi:helix-turn-helix domain-containing protein [Hydrogenimonas sp.]